MMRPFYRHLYLLFAIDQLQHLILSNIAVVNAEGAVTGTMTPSPVLIPAPPIATSSPILISPAPVGTVVSQTPTITVGDITAIPSNTPTKPLKVAKFEFKQRFERSVADNFNATEVLIFENIIADYTSEYGNGDLVTTVCDVLNQEIKSRVIGDGGNEVDDDDLAGATENDGSETYDVVRIEDYNHDAHYLRGKQQGHHELHRGLQVLVNLDLEYSITFSSREEDVDSYGQTFLDHLDANLIGFRDIMVDNGLMVNEVISPQLIISETAAPSSAPIQINTSAFDFRQNFYRMTSGGFNEAERKIFESIVVRYAPRYIDANDVNQVVTTVEVSKQSEFANFDPNINATIGLRMEYTITHESNTVDSSGYDELYTSFINNETAGQLQEFVIDLNDEGIEVIFAEEATLKVVIPTPAPTPKTSSFPSGAPTLFLKSKTSQFRHVFYRPIGANEINSTQTIAFQDIISGFTPRYGEMKGSPVIITTCEIIAKDSLVNDAETKSLSIDYEITYSSREVDIAFYQYESSNFMSNETIRLEFQDLLNAEGMDITDSEPPNTILPVPSAAPTVTASVLPTTSQKPTSANPKEVTKSFSQKFSRPKDIAEASLTPEEVPLFEQIIVELTPEYAQDPQFVSTNCTISSQQVSVLRRYFGVRYLWLKLNRFLQVTVDPLETADLTLTYEITWQSARTDLSGYAQVFQAFMNDGNGADLLLDELNSNGIDMESVNDVAIIITTDLSTAYPTMSGNPTRMPYQMPSVFPSAMPSISKIPSSAPSLGDVGGGGSSTSTAIIVGAAVCSVVLVAGLGFLWWKKRKQA